MTDATELDEAGVQAAIREHVIRCRAERGYSASSDEAFASTDATFLLTALDKARTDLPAALDEITRLRAALDEARTTIRQLSGANDDVREVARGWRTKWERAALPARGYPIWRARAETAESALADVTRLAQHLAEDAQKTRCELTAFPAEGDMHEHHREDRGRCKGDVVGVRWEDGWADWICERHAASTEARGVLVVRPARHDGAALATPTTTERSEG